MYTQMYKEINRSNVKKNDRESSYIIFIFSNNAYELQLLNGKHKQVNINEFRKEKKRKYTYIYSSVCKHRIK